MCSHLVRSEQHLRCPKWDLTSSLNKSRRHTRQNPADPCFARRDKLSLECHSSCSLRPTPGTPWTASGDPWRTCKQCYTWSVFPTLRVCSCTRCSNKHAIAEPSKTTTQRLNLYEDVFPKQTSQRVFYARWRSIPSPSRSAKLIPQISKLFDGWKFADSLASEKILQLIHLNFLSGYLKNITYVEFDVFTETNFDNHQPVTQWMLQNT